MPRKLIIIILLTLLLACSRETIDRAEWQRMANADRVLYVKSMVGAEKVKDAKGGGGKQYDRPAEEYVAAIDTAYARGDAREANKIFGELGK
jgi:type III secretory pathway lipoprotein EscJ